MFSPFSDFLTLLLGGGCLVFFISWVVSRRSIYNLSSKVNETIAILQQEGTLKTRFEERVRWMEEENERLQRTHMAEQEMLRTLRSDNVELRTLLDKERTLTKEKEVLLLRAEERFKDSFQALSSEALKSNNQAFLLLAKNSLEKFQETAQCDLKQRQDAIKELVNPLKEALGSVDKKIQEIEQIRLGAYEGLKQQVQDLVLTQKDLRFETQNLANALRTPHVRGRWGEMQLKRVVEMAGMIAHCDFEEQATHQDDEGRLRPDMIIRLPNQKNIIVDAKTPLASYLEALETTNPEEKNRKLATHAKQVRSHILALGAKSYWTKFDPTPEFVVLFLPGETFFSAALEQDPSLIELGAEQKVILATPTTLIALLRAVAYGWRQEQVAENAKEISALGQELYKRLSDMGQHIARVGKHLEGAVGAYNQTVGTFENRVFVTARKFQELGAADRSRDLERIEPIEKSPRDLVKTEN